MVPGCELEISAGYLSFLEYRVNTPVMLLTMGHEQRTDEECRLWSDLRGPRVAVNLRGSEHLTPSDVVWLAPGAIKTGSMSMERIVAGIRDNVAAFLDANLSRGTTKLWLRHPFGNAWRSWSIRADS